MKKYEKLALDSIKYIPVTEEYTRKLCELAFKNGFIQARQMAIKLTEKPAWLLIREIRILGEKEV